MVRRLARRFNRPRVSGICHRKITELAPGGQDIGTVRT
jgi:hypothetical protein